LGKIIFIQGKLEESFVGKGLAFGIQILRRDT